MTRELDDATRCSYVSRLSRDVGVIRQCDGRGTHRLVIVLLSHGDPPIAKKYLWADEKGMPVRRCEAHHEMDPKAFVNDAVWNRLAENFARAGFKNTASMQIPIADRSRMAVFWVDDVTKIEDVPVMAEVDGRAEQVGTARVLS